MLKALGVAVGCGREDLQSPQQGAGNMLLEGFGAIRIRVLEQSDELRIQAVL